ncbi:MAG TPA: glutamate--tRNA ligase [bacterium]|nr:glutamate--tRNA ligase [bacterium]
MNDVRVRFAPSPTGYLHLGGARTAIYNWLYARRHNGKFLLRIEDTDKERSDPAMVEQIKDSLKWLKVDWDEDIVFQSKREHLYKEVVDKLLEEGKAYRCFCTDEELEADRKKYEKKKGSYKYSGKCRNLSQEEIEKNLEAGKDFSVRLKIERPGTTQYEDMIYGNIEVNNKDIDDFIIQRSDGTPTYQLAVVVDDADMRISHVIRGEDHVPNTPKQINLFDALGKQYPKYGHLPLLIGKDKKRLSKRHGATAVDQYKEMGFSAESVINYLTLLGRTAKSDKEVMTIEQIKADFAIDKISRKPTVFDIKKLEWLSGKHMSRKSVDELYKEVLPRFVDKGWVKSEPENPEYIKSIIKLLKSRVKTYNNFAEWGDYFFVDPREYARKAAKKRWKSEEVNKRMQKLYDRLTNVENWNPDKLEEVIRGLADDLGVGAGKVIHPLRLALTGYGISPGIFKLVNLIGKEKTLKRLEKAMKKLPI